MQSNGIIAAIERFHLLLLAQLGTRLDKKLYALKGGCNLRFFFKSIRYSEDIDFDVQTIARETLRKNVNQILSSPGFRSILRSADLEIARSSDAKQTDTTQRWKIHLRDSGTGADLPTKVEFSRRAFGNGVEFEPVDGVLIAAYHLSPIITSHYSLEAALGQKVEALLGRRETQARDVFDLNFLVERGGNGVMISGAARSQAWQACESVMSVTFEEFKGQVVAYLAPEYQSYYGTRPAWEKLQERVIRLLESI